MDGNFNDVEIPAYEESAEEKAQPSCVNLSTVFDPKTASLQFENLTIIGKLRLHFHTGGLVNVQHGLIRHTIYYKGVSHTIY